MQQTTLFEYVLPKTTNSLLSLDKFFIAQLRRFEKENCQPINAFEYLRNEKYLTTTSPVNLFQYRGEVTQKKSL